MMPTAQSPILSVQDLRVEFDVDGESHRAVAGSNFAVAPGEVVAIVGESGSGKSITAMSILGLLPSNATVTGAILFEGVDLRTVAPPALRRLRGSKIGMIFQDPIAALNPVFTVGFQVAEAVSRQAPGLDRAGVRRRVRELFDMVEIPDPATRVGQYPHQLSGGQCQRIMIAMALASEPALLIADEPTTALDVTVQAEVLDLLRSMRGRIGSAILLITHDMGVVADLADRVIVMRAGEIVETNTAQQLFTAPTAAYTRELLAAVPRIRTQARPVAASGSKVDGGARPVLNVDRLVVEFGPRLRGRFRAVDGVSLNVEKGEILALVGESGSGKTTIARAAIGLAPVSGGAIEIAGVDLKTARRRDIASMRQRVGVVFQNPATSLNPRNSVADTIGEPLRVHRGIRGSELRDRVDVLLASVGFSADWRDRYAHELSGGERQRVAIARAVALDPELLIADEPTSALDVSVQARVLDVFRELQSRLGFACLFVTHDLAVVDTLCDRVAVLNHGVLVESGTRDEVLGNPKEPYTQRLIASAPVPDPVLQRVRRLERLAS